jgi:hypothetical protein
MTKMKNITVSISETAYLRARVWTAEHGSSLSSVVAYLLETLPKIECAKNYYRARTQTPQASGEKPLTVPGSRSFSASAPSPLAPAHPPPPLPSTPTPLPTAKVGCETVELVSN